MSVTPTWWEILSTVGSAAATIAVAIFAALQLVRDRRIKLARERAALIRISGAGYLLRQRLSRWMAYDHRSADGLANWVGQAKRQHSYESEVAGALAECREMMNLLDDAPLAVAKDVRELFVYLVEGTRRLSEFAAMPEPDHVEIFVWVDLRDHAYDDFRECLQLLEAGTIVERVLLNEELLLSRLRSSQTLAARLTEALERDHAQDAVEPIAKDPETLRDEPAS